MVLRWLCFFELVWYSLIFVILNNVIICEIWIFVFMLRICVWWKDVMVYCEGMWLIMSVRSLKFILKFICWNELSIFWDGWGGIILEISGVL